MLRQTLDVGRDELTHLNLQQGSIKVEEYTPDLRQLFQILSPILAADK
jgi:hypothetical protein